MGYGVIGSPADSGSVSLGSSPSTPATEVPIRWKGLRIGRLPGPDRCTHLVGPARAPLCSGLARRPLKAVARVRIPSGLQSKAPSQPYFAADLKATSSPSVHTGYTSVRAE